MVTTLYPRELNLPKLQPGAHYPSDVRLLRAFPHPPSRYDLNRPFNERRVVGAVLGLYLHTMCPSVAEVDEWVGFSASLFLAHAYAAASEDNDYDLHGPYEARNGVFGLHEEEYFRIEVRPGTRELLFPTPHVLDLLWVREG